MTSLTLSVLSELKKRLGQNVSGQNIADKLGVSRNSVSKAVTALREEGYEISSATRSGYTLKKTTDRVSKDELDMLFGEKLSLFVYDTIDSTNNEARRLISADMALPMLVVSDAQSAGRGRHGRSFFSPAGSGIYMSVVLTPEQCSSDAVFVTTAAAVAVCKSIEEVTGINSQIKWVNDVFVGGKKVCGILTEAISDFESGAVSHIIVGIGLNITTEKFPDEISEIAGCLCDEKLDRNKLIFCITENLCELARQDFLMFADYYRSHCFVLNQKILFTDNGNWLPGVAVGINNSGGLIVSTKSGEKVLCSGEVSLRLEK